MNSEVYKTVIEHEGQLVEAVSNFASAYAIDMTYVTGSAKTSHVRTKI